MLARWPPLPLMSLEPRLDGRIDGLTASPRHPGPHDQWTRGVSPTHGRRTHVASKSRDEALMKLALVTIVTANLDQMRTFSQEVL
jgi:hypothetical protein